VGAHLDLAYGVLVTQSESLPRQCPCGAPRKRRQPSYPLKIMCCQEKQHNQQENNTNKDGKAEKTHKERKHMQM
jgi:hypothetical protein